MVEPGGQRLGPADGLARPARWTGRRRCLLLLGLAMIGPLFSQSAWNNVTFTGGEIRDPGRTLPRAMILGCVDASSCSTCWPTWPTSSRSLSSEIQHAPQDRVGTAADGGRSSARAARSSWPARS